MSKHRSEKNGSKNDDWATPDYILDDIRKEFGEFFDPCPLKNDKALWDGLKEDWNGPVHFINPPYNNKDKVAFINKAYEESLKGKVCILLVPAATELPIFHDLILPHAEVRFIRRRVKFKGFNSKGVYTEKGTGQMGSMFVIFDGRKKGCLNSFEHELYGGKIIQKWYCGQKNKRTGKKEYCYNCSQNVQNTSEVKA